MNVLYSGDTNALDGLIISTISLLRNTKETLHFYILTMDYKDETREFFSINKKQIEILNQLIQSYNPTNDIKLFNVTNLFSGCMPKANINTRFTPYCMLGLYADQIEDIPSKILYLDNDVVCLNNPKEFYDIDNSEYELAGSKDYYGSKLLQKDYLNAGVLLLNMDLIKESGLFKKARERCQTKKMYMPDQTALNMLAKHKLIVDEEFNNQRKITKNTVFRHFTSTFKLWPKIHTQSIKPWNINELHNVMNVHEFDDILEEYKEIKERMNNAE